MNTPSHLPRLPLRIAGALSAALLAGAALSACSSPPEAEAPRGPYAAEFERARAASVTDEQREILEDESISEEEYLRLEDRLLSCLTEAGFPAQRGEPGAAPAIEGDPEDPALVRAKRGCTLESIGPVETLYHSLRNNPEALPWSDVYAACFVRVGLAPEGFTGDMLDALNEAGHDHEDDTPEEAAIEHGDEILIPGGGSLSSAEATACYENPRGH